ncbi:ladderlectin [Pimephales promelas]|nr:ladderlectin [Pimephales promelas]
MDSTVLRCHDRLGEGSFQIHHGSAEKSFATFCYLLLGQCTKIDTCKKMPTWMESSWIPRLCQSLGANLASVHDKEENDFLLGLMPASTRTWIGAHDGEQDGEWFWSDGSLFNHNNWCSEEPNNSDGPENCLEIDWSCECTFSIIICNPISYHMLMDSTVLRCHDRLGEGSFQIHHGSAEKSFATFCYLLLGQCTKIETCKKMPTWMESSWIPRLCQSLGANLASVHDKEENDFLLGLMPASTRTWIGAHDGEQDGEWFWSDGSLFNYNNWCSEEPNNFDGPENCLEIDWTWLLDVLPLMDSTVLRCHDRLGEGSFQIHHGSAEKSFATFCYLLLGQCTKIDTCKKMPTWMESSWIPRLCQSLGANLASVHDKEENDFLLGLMPASTRTWIGAHDGEQDGEWFWSDGSLFNYNNWCSEEPNNSDGPENCLEIDWSSDRCWNDASCSTSMSYICVLDVRVPR